MLAGAASMQLWFHASTFFPRWTDENVHLYVARRVAEGLVLYRDIHSARPPLALVPLVVGQWCGLSPLWTARGAVLLVVLTTAAALWWAGRRLMGPWQGVAAATLFLACPETSARSVWTGIHLVALGALVCVALAWRGRPFASGLAGGLALAAGQHAAVLVAGAGFIVLLRERGRVLRFLGGVAGALGATLGVVAAVAGLGALWEDLFGRHLYHLTTGPAEGDLSFFLLTTALDSLAWLVLAAAALWPGLPSRGGEARDVRWLRWWLGALVVGHVGAVAVMAGGLVLYLFPAVPLVALLGGDGVVRLVAWAGSRGEGVGRAWWGGWVGRGLALAAACVGVVLLGWYGATSRYERRDRREYAVVAPLRQVQMARSQRLSMVPRLVELIGPMLREGDTLFGYPLLASAVALALDRRLAGEWADLAPRWLAMGLVSRKEVIEGIEADHVRVFLAQLGVFERDPVFREYLTRCYLAPSVIERAVGDGGGLPRVVVYRHIDGRCLE